MIEEKVKKISLHNKIEIAYTDTANAASAATLLFIHGLANYRKVWYWNIAGLQHRYRCISVDLPGNGQSSRGDYPYTISFYSECIREFIQLLDLSNVVLVGHSMGGQIALYLSLQYPSLCPKMILAAPAGLEYFSPYEVVMMKQSVMLGNLFPMDEMHLSQAVENSFYVPSAIMRTIIDELHQLIRQHDRLMYRKMVERCIHSMLDTPVYSSLELIATDTLVLFGNQDMLIPNRLLHGSDVVAMASAAVKKMPSARLEIIKNAGHFLQIEKADEWNKSVISFLDDKQGE